MNTNFKNIEATLAMVDNLVTDKSVTISKPGDLIDSQNGKLRKLEHGGYELEFEYKRGNSFSLFDVDDIVLQSDSQDFEIENLSVLNVSVQTANGMISKFNSKGFNNAIPTYNRLVLSLDKIIEFRFCIPFTSYQTNTVNSLRCVRVAFDKLALDIYVYENRKNDLIYLIVDTVAFISQKEFSEYCFASLLSLGYITGKLVQTEGFYFIYQDNSLEKPTAFTYSALRKSISTIYIPIYANALGLKVGPLKLGYQDGKKM